MLPFLDVFDISLVKLHICKALSLNDCHGHFPFHKRFYIYDVTKRKRLVTGLEVSLLWPSPITRVKEIKSRQNCAKGRKINILRNLTLYNNNYYK